MNLPVIATVTTTPNPPHSQPPPPIPNIPYDILTLIIDQLRHDIPTLRACTLTARSWTHRARVHLHRSLTLEVDVQGCDFRFPGAEDEEKFRVMGREVPVVLRYADELTLKCVDSSRSGARGRSGAPLSTILHLLRHIRVLRIIDADLSTIFLSSSCHTQDSNPSWTTAFPNLDTLVLSKTSFRSPYDVVRLVRSFSGVRTFRVENIVVADDSSHASDDDSNHAFGVVGNPSFEAPTIRNLHILNCTKSPGLIKALATHLTNFEENTNLRKLHVDTTSHAEVFKALKNAEVESGVEEMHLALTEELYPLWHVHPEGKVSNMTAPDIRAAIQPVFSCKGLRTLRLSVQRSPIVRMVQTMEGCDQSILCSPWQVYREALVGLGFASASYEALATSDKALVGLFGKQEGAEPDMEDREGKEKFKCLELCLSFDARDIQGPRTHISSFESALCSLSLSSSNSNETNTGKGKDKAGVESVKFLIKEFIDPVLPDEPARLRRLWGALVERLRARLPVVVRGDGEVEVGVEFFDRRDFEW